MLTGIPPSKVVNNNHTLVESDEPSQEELAKFELMRLYTIITNYSENRLEHDIKEQKQEILVYSLLTFRPSS